MRTGLLYHRHSGYQPNRREPERLLASGLSRTYHTRSNSECNLWVQVDIRYGDDEVDNGLGLQSLFANLVQPYDVSLTLQEACLPCC